MSCLHAAFSVNSRSPILFLVDTGAAVSIIPPKFCQGIDVTQSEVMLSTVDGSPIVVYGECHTVITNKQLRRSFSWNFVVANTASPVLGADFLTANKIVVNCSECCILDMTTGLSARCTSNRSHNSVSLTYQTQTQSVTSLLEKYNSLLQPLQFTYTQVKTATTHIIDTADKQPVFAKTRQMHPEKLKAAKEEIRKLLEQGIIRPSNSSWSSPLHMVKKLDGG